MGPSALPGALFVFACLLLAFGLSSLPTDTRLEDVPSRSRLHSAFASCARTSPAVVNIYTRKASRKTEPDPFFSDPFFQYFFEGLEPKARTARASAELARFRRDHRR